MICQFFLKSHEVGADFLGSPPARLAFMRLPNTLQSSPLPTSIANLISATMKRNYTQVYNISDALLNVVAQTTGSQQALAEVIARMVTAFLGQYTHYFPLSLYLIHILFLETFRARTFQLLSQAYTSLPVALAQTYIGLPVDQLLAGMSPYRMYFTI